MDKKGLLNPSLKGYFPKRKQYIQYKKLVFTSSMGFPSRKYGFHLMDFIYLRFYVKNSYYPQNILYLSYTKYTIDTW